MAQLPSLFFIRARVRDDPEPGQARYCLVSATPIESPGNGILWKTNIVEGSKHLVSGATYRHDGIESRAEVFWHERDTRINPSGVFYYECKMWRTKNYLMIPGEGQVWEYDMTHANRVLPSKFNHVGNCKDRCKKWHFTLNDLQVARVVPIIETTVARAEPTVTRSKIPAHIFHAFVEMAVSKREECPISMEPITCENVGCPPCGHLFEKEGLRRALENNRACPTCRVPATVEDIQVW
jgi:hypothetical protein